MGLFIGNITSTQEVFILIEKCDSDRLEKLENTAYERKMII